MIVQKCLFDGPDHEYPDDWQFGGANGQDPRADPRFEVNNYTYFDADVQPIWVTSVPRCDDEAIDMFTWVGQLGPDFKPKWLSVRRADGTEQMLKLTYDKTTDVVTEVVPA